MVTIDGSQGEGGGQIVRSALALSLVTGKPLQIIKIRAGRKKPGLMRQHVAAVRSAAAISDAQVEGAVLGGSSLTFRPSQLLPGDYEFRVGSAGSTTLVLQTVLPALLIAHGPSTLTLEGGTHNPWAPPFEFISDALLPLLARLGPRVTAKLEAYGFYPAGAGRIKVSIEPVPKLGRLELVERGRLVARRVRAIVAKLPAHIAERECHTITSAPGWEECPCQIDRVTGSQGPGNVVMISIKSERVMELFTGFGRRGVPAEVVAAGVQLEAQSYLDSGVPVGPYLADQLMLPLAIGAHQGSGGGVFRTSRLTRHAQTQVEVIQSLLEVRVRSEETRPDQWTVEFPA
jgi:RNA 3'-terminal phosphate cyclase (ATP)